MNGLNNLWMFNDYPLIWKLSLSPIFAFFLCGTFFLTLKYQMSNWADEIDPEHVSSNITGVTKFRSVINPPTIYIDEINSTAEAFSYTIERGICKDKQWINSFTNKSRNISVGNIMIPARFVSPNKLFINCKPPGLQYIDNGWFYKSNRNVRDEIEKKQELFSSINGVLDSALNFHGLFSTAVNIVLSKQSLDMFFRDCKDGEERIRVRIFTTNSITVVGKVFRGILIDGIVGDSSFDYHLLINEKLSVLSQIVKVDGLIFAVVFVIATLLNYSKTESLFRILRMTIIILFVRMMKASKMKFILLIAIVFILERVLRMFVQA